MTKKLIPIAVLAAGMLFCSCGKIEDPSSKESHINIPAVSLFDSSSVPDDDSSVPVPPDTEPEPQPEPEPKPEPKPDQDEIVILYRYQNWAWGVQDSGSFIDASGAVYEFNFANGESYDYEPLSGDELINALTNIQQNEKPLHYIDEDTMQKIIELIPYVNKDAERAEEYVACDAGQHTVYIVEGAKLTELWSTGDCDRELIDPVAEKIHEILDKT